MLVVEYVITSHPLTSNDNMTPMTMATVMTALCVKTKRDPFEMERLGRLLERLVNATGCRAVYIFRAKCQTCCTPSVYCTYL